MPSTLPILLKLKSSRSSESKPSLKREQTLAQATWSRLSETANREHVEVSLRLAQLAQASPTRLGETVLAQASGPRLGEPSNLRRGEMLLRSLRRELLA